jgi:hypothetical protein
MAEAKTNAADRALLACSLWLHTGFIGATVLAGGLILLLRGETSPIVSLPVALAGAIVAVACWHRSFAVLQSAERTAAIADRALIESPAHPGIRVRRERHGFRFSAANRPEAH